MDLVVDVLDDLFEDVVEGKVSERDALDAEITPVDRYATASRPYV